MMRKQRAIVAPLPTPRVRIVQHIHASSPKAQDGEVIVSWDAVFLAARYDAYARDWDGGWRLVEKDVKPPYKFTGIAAGVSPDRFGIRACAQGLPSRAVRTYLRFMVNTRTPGDGFKGEYPAPLDWGRIIEELGGGTDTGETEDSSTLNP